MRRFFFLAICFLYSIFSIYAQAPSESPSKAAVAPRSGGFGLNMASDYYAFPDSINHAGAGMPSSAGSGKYGDDAIIAIAGVWNINTWSNTPGTGGYYADENYDSPMTITVSCDNGFYFVSNSNPDAKRPFEVKLVFSTSTSSDPFEPGLEANTDRFSAISLGKNSEIRIDSEEFPHSDYSWGWGRWRYIWCDIVICLPYVSHTSTGSLVTGDGHVYNLVEATDYSAVVTINVEWNGQYDSITIPMSGYYSRNPQEMDSSASLVINTLPRAMNLNISEDNRGYAPVANVHFMSNSDNVQHIFLSASNDPNVPAPRGFELVHSSVNYSTPLTSLNSIGFTAMLRSDNKTEEFEGSDYINGSDIPGILMDLITDSDTGSTVQYSEFNGDIQVLIDPVQEDVAMLDGQYTGNIYVHVVEGT